MGFILRPFNFFNESAAISLPDVVRIPGQVSPDDAKKITGNSSATEADIADIVAALQPFRGTLAPQVDTCMPTIIAPPFTPDAMPTAGAINAVLEILASVQPAAAAPEAAEGAPAAAPAAEGAPAAAPAAEGAPAAAPAAEGAPAAAPAAEGAPAAGSAPPASPAEQAAAAPSPTVAG